MQTSLSKLFLLQPLWSAQNIVFSRREFDHRLALPVSMNEWIK